MLNSTKLIADSKYLIGIIITSWLLVITSDIIIQITMKVNGGSSEVQMKVKRESRMVYVKVKTTQMEVKSRKEFPNILP